MEVTLGQNVGRWFVAFAGQYAGKDVPLLKASHALISNVVGAVVVSATSYLEDTGRTERVRSLIPMGSPTPLVAGAMVIALWFPRIGYGVVSAECRDYSVEDPYAY